jgi:hypothetical protein
MHRPLIRTLLNKGSRESAVGHHNSPHPVQTTAMPFLHLARANELANMRTLQELNLLTAIMAHPSYGPASRELTTREGRSC